MSIELIFWLLALACLAGLVAAQRLLGRLRTADRGLRTKKRLHGR